MIKLILSYLPVDMTDSRPSCPTMVRLMYETEWVG